VRAAQLEGLLDQGAERRRMQEGSAWVRSGQRVWPVNAEATHQVTHRAADKTQGTRDGAGTLTVCGLLGNHLTQGHRSRVRHEQSSLENVFNLEAHGTVSPLLRPGKTS
jgi:hypothetical protein